MPRIRRRKAWARGERPAGAARPPVVLPPRLSEELSALVTELGERPVRLREVVATLRGRAYTLLLIFLALPFCTPIPLPGLSTLFGVVIALIGFRLTLRQKPWLPARVLDATLPPKFFGRVLAAARKLVWLLEYLLKPRWAFLIERGVLHHAYGAIILISGLLLLLPLPIPFTNLLPALTVVLIASALLEQDGYFVVAGLVVFALTVIVFGVLFWGGAEAAGWLKEHFSGVFQPDYENAP